MVRGGERVVRGGERVVRGGKGVRVVKGGKWWGKFLPLFVKSD